MSPLEFVSCSRLCAKSERRVRVEKPDELCFIISFSYFSQQTVEINSISFFYSSPVQVSPAPTSGKTSQIALSAISCIFIQTILSRNIFRLNSDKGRARCDCGGETPDGKNQELLRVGIDLLSVLSILLLHIDLIQFLQSSPTL